MDEEKGPTLSSLQQEVFVLERKNKETSMRIGLVRNFNILLSLFSIILLIPVVSIQNVLQDQLKIWLMGVGIFAFVAILVALFLSRNDSTTTLFTTNLLTVISGTILGIVLCSLHKIVGGTQ